jgi:hypothetical protein
MKFTTQGTRGYLKDIVIQIGLGSGVTSWRSCKQTMLTKSTMEAELMALDTASTKVEWLRELLINLPMVEKQIPAILINCDNQMVITKVKNSQDDMKSTKHVKRRLKSGN